MKVIVAKKCGFCPGVRNAISIAEKILEQSTGHLTVEKEVYSLGPIIHNKDVVEQLAKKGLKTVNKVEEIESGTVLIRSHGVGPEVIEKLKQKQLNIVDATCVLVKRVQKIARELAADGYKVVVIGNENHPEVQAVVGCGNDVVVIADESDLDKLDKNNRLGIVCQTTQSSEHFSKMLCAIAHKGFNEVKAINTLCKEVIERQKSAEQLAKRVDVMFVLGGLESANTRTLVELCKKYNKKTFHLQNWKEFDIRKVLSENVAGITAGASTPDWIISEFVENLEAININNPKVNKKTRIEGEY